MRFPNNTLMQRTFRLVDQLREEGQPLKLIPYILSDVNIVNYFPYDSKISTYIDQKYLNEGAENITNGVLSGPVSLFQNVTNQDELAAATKELVDKYDLYSMRSFMTIPPPFAGFDPYPSSVVNWCEVGQGSTSAFDRGLTEIVFDILAFNWPQAAPVDFWCFECVTQSSL